MLRTHRYGDEGDFSWQDHLKDHVKEAAPKRKGKKKNMDAKMYSFSRRRRAHRPRSPSVYFN